MVRRIRKGMAAGLIIVMMSFLLAACGREGKEESGDLPEQTTEESESTRESEFTGESKPVEDSEPTEESESTGESESTEPGDASEGEDGSEAADFVIPVQEDFTPAEGLSDKYIDFENRAFAYNGTVFKLGESTLKDLIDGGIPFDERDLNNKGNNVNVNYESNRYTAEINDYVTMQFKFVNITDETLTEEECLLSYIRFYYLYVPQPNNDAERNALITESIFDAADVVCFSFPATLTKEQLLENCSEGAEQDDYNHVEYRISSEVYLGSSGYYFSFDKETNQMKEVTISWLP